MLTMGRRRLHMHFLFIIMARETLSFTVQPKVGRWNILHTLPWGLDEVGS